MIMQQNKKLFLFVCIIHNLIVSLHPKFEEVRGGFMATIKRERFLRTRGNEFVVEDVVVELTERQKVIYGIIKKSVVEDVVVTAVSIAEKIKKSTRTVQRELTILKEKKLIRHIGSDKQGRWEIVIE